MDDLATATASWTWLRSMAPARSRSCRGSTRSTTSTRARLRICSHVTQLSFDYAGNYHYLALGVDGRELHQLLPLTSTRFAPDVPHQKVAFGEHVVTDLRGCHGTSGSGALQRSELGPWQLLGPATFGDIELSQYLCNHQPSLSGNRHGPGASGISCASLDQTHALLAIAADRFREDCMAWPRGETTLCTHLACPREGLAADPVVTARATGRAALRFEVQGEASPPAPRSDDAGTGVSG